MGEDVPFHQTDFWMSKMSPMIFPFYFPNDFPHQFQSQSGSMYEKKIQIIIIYDLDLLDHIEWASAQVPPTPLIGGGVL